MPALMTNTQHVAKLAAVGRAHVVRLDHERAACVVRLDPPRGGAAGWPVNVVALRVIPYNAARGMRGLIGG